MVTPTFIIEHNPLHKFNPNELELIQLDEEGLDKYALEHLQEL